MAAAQVRLEALAAVQTVACVEGGSASDEGAPVASEDASARDAVSIREQAESPSCAAAGAPPSADERPHAQVEGAETGAVLASEELAQALQTREKVREMGALGRFDRWFFGDLALLWRARA
jgi:hypothetical protein